MGWFGRGQQEREAQAREAREQEAREWLRQNEAEKQARAEAREAQASEAQAGGGIFHTGAEDLTISGQAFGQGATVRSGPAAEAGGRGGASRGDAGSRQADRGGQEGPYILNTGSGAVNVQRSAVGHGIQMTNYGDRESVVTEAPQTEQGLEAGQ